MEVEDEFFFAVKRNDIGTIDRLINTSEDPPDINDVDEDGRTALAIAIECGHTDMIEHLLQYNIDTGDSLLYAIQVQSVQAVKILCTHFSEQGINEVKVNEFANTTAFPSYMTPLLLAAKLNKYEILKIILDHGARMPTLAEVQQRVSKETHERAIARHAWHRAHASDAYILLSSKDPMQTAFEMAARLKKLSITLPQLKDDYELLISNLEGFVTTLLEYVRNGEEIATVLWAGVEDDNERLPSRLMQALRIDFKRFIAHPNCQEYTLARWYLGNKKWRGITKLRYGLMSLIVSLLYPVLSIIYIFLPWDSFSRMVKTPYVRFLLHTSSRMTFFGMLVYITLVQSVRHNCADKEKADECINTFDEKVFTCADILLYIWIAGMTWREIQELHLSGIRSYCYSKWNWVDVSQLTLYWISFGYALVAHSTNKGTSGNIDLSASTNTSSLEVPQAMLLEPAAVAATKDMSLFISEETRYGWYWNDPLLVAEATFSIATVLTCMTLLRNLVIFEFAGPLQIALAGMAANVCKFLMLFCIIWISYGMGLTLLYQTFAALNKIAENGDSECWFRRCSGGDAGFDSLTGSLGTLFWSMFDLTDPAELKLQYGSLYLTEFTGMFMYASFMVIAVIIMLNALIAMMSNTYTAVEQNALCEWKVARTRLVNEYSSDSATLPPPFNLVPSVKTIHRMVINTRDFFCAGKDDTVNLRTPSRKLNSSLAEQKYKAVIEALVKRHLTHLRTTAIREKQSDALYTYIKDLQATITGLREELLRKSRENL